MKFGLLKYKLLSRPFSTNLKIDTNFSKVKLDPIKIPEDFHAPDKHGGLLTEPPRPGETYNVPYINSKLLALELGYTRAFERDPVSAYYSMKVGNQMYHVFNAARISLGKMSAKIAFIIQGKNSPHYKPNTILKNTDLCVIVNAKHTWLTGKKLEQKLYRHHTGFPGGLKEIKARHYLEKNPSEMLLRTIKGMTPKNKLRREYLKFVKIYDEGGHDLWKLGLPQFGKVKPIDYNEIFGLNDVLSGKAKILSSNIPENELPPEMKNLERANLEDQPKTVVNQRMKIKFDKYTKIWRYRQYRNIRNKSYRYI